MNKLLAIAAICLFGTSAMATDTAATKPQQKASPEILSIATFNVTDGVSVQLPKWRMVDGTICQSYVAAAGESTVPTNKGGPMNKVQITMGQVCGKPKVTTAGLSWGETEEAPENLKAMRTVSSDGLAIQLPDLLFDN